MSEPFLPAPEIFHLEGAAQAEFQEKALAATREHFGSQVFVRAVVEISNFCRADCTYCGMRRGNRALSRYRALPEQLADLLIHHRPPSVTDINIQAGEDPIAVREVALPLIRTLRRETNLGITVCLGNLDHRLFAELKDSGASIYIMKFEVANPTLYTDYQGPGSLATRLANIRHLAATGWHVSSGFIAGLPGQNDAEMASNIALAQSLPLRGCSVSPFIPGEATPLASATRSAANLALNCMAVLRLSRPDWIIPAVSALNLVDPAAGYRRGLRSGANLVTINMTPPDLRENYLLYKRDRFIMTEDRILSAIAAEGLTPSTVSMVDFYNSVSETSAPTLDVAALAAPLAPS